jgi:sugar-specific transcriptional regulator TrmB
MPDTTDLLQQLGFSQYEAQAYLALLRENPLNGYELARASGIPRPNVYPVLQKLVARGAARQVDTPEGAEYAPVPPEELLTRLRARFQTTLEAASGGLQQVAAAPTREQILNLRGRPAMLEEARTLLAQAGQNLLVSTWPEEALELAGPLHQAQERGVRITTLCLRGCEQPCPACRGEVYRYPVARDAGRRWLVLVSDDQKLLAGEVAPSGDALAVLTRQPMLVNLSAGYIQNSIALASILSALGDRLDDLLDEPTCAALNRLQPPHAELPWLAYMLRMLHLTDKEPRNENE